MVRYDGPPCRTDAVAAIPMATTRTVVSWAVPRQAPDLITQAIVTRTSWCVVALTATRLRCSEVIDAEGIGGAPDVSGVADHRRP